jgi:hypothetical protein
VRVPGALRTAAITIVGICAIGCGGNSGLERLSRARSLSADLLVQFTKAADASNKAVMATSDEASIAFARDADVAKQAVQTDVEAIDPVLKALDYADELRLVQEFGPRFAAYREMDRRILELAVENTNIKAQRLSFGPAQEAADAFAASLETAAPLNVARDAWRVKALAATAVAEVRQIQALQAPHIANAEDTEMSRMEERMAASEKKARVALETLGPLVQPGSRSALTAAADALDRFMALNAQITALSRRNTNVHSLALTLNDKGKLTRECEDTLAGLRAALDKRGFTATR